MLSHPFKISGPRPSLKAGEIQISHHRCGTHSPGTSDRMELPQGVCYLTSRSKKSGFGKQQDPRSINRPQDPESHERKTGARESA